MSKSKPKMAFYWAASCGGCEISVAELGMRLVEIGEKVDILFWPCIMDYKYDDIRALKNKEIDFCFFNGGIRNTENEEIAHLLRAKSKNLVAFGACAHIGGIPGLANLSDVETMLERVFDTCSTLDSSKGTRPIPKSQVPEGEITVPALLDRVKTLAQTVEVDYFMPGCPPVVDQIWNVFQDLLTGKVPIKGSFIGVDPRTNCDTCLRQKGKSGNRIKEFKRPHEVLFDPSICFLPQGIICAGPATRAGCGLPCIKGNMPCRGCYGAPEGVIDQGAKLMSALGAIIDTDKPEELEKIISSVSDMAGYGYRFSLANSLMNNIKYNNSSSKE
jgi:F420-non-reducing hydrogenase small subunit